MINQICSQLYKFHKNIIHRYKKIEDQGFQIVNRPIIKYNDKKPINKFRKIEKSELSDIFQILKPFSDFKQYNSVSSGDIYYDYIDKLEITKLNCDKYNFVRIGYNIGYTEYCENHLVFRPCKKIIVDNKIYPSNKYNIARKLIPKHEHISICVSYDELKDKKYVIFTTGCTCVDAD